MKCYSFRYIFIHHFQILPPSTIKLVLLFTEDVVLQVALLNSMMCIYCRRMSCVPMRLFDSDHHITKKKCDCRERGGSSLVLKWLSALRNNENNIIYIIHR